LFDSRISIHNVLLPQSATLKQHNAISVSMLKSITVKFGHCHIVMFSLMLKFFRVVFIQIHINILHNNTIGWNIWMSSVATPLWAKCEDETHTPKSGNLESFGTPKNSELDRRGQNTSHWGVLYIVGNFLKCRCPKWPCMSHLDICSLSYEQKKGRESNWQFDSRPLKVGNRPDSDVYRRSATWHWKALKESYKIASDLIPIKGLSKML